MFLVNCSSLNYLFRSVFRFNLSHPVDLLWGWTPRKSDSQRRFLKMCVCVWADFIRICVQSRTVQLTIIFLFQVNRMQGARFIGIVKVHNWFWLWCFMFMRWPINSSCSYHLSNLGAWYLVGLVMDWAILKKIVGPTRWRHLVVN